MMPRQSVFDMSYAKVFTGAVCGVKAETIEDPMTK